jgi:HK97 gp10 family phage protein
MSAGKGVTYKGLKELIAFNNKLSQTLTTATNTALRQQSGPLLSATQRVVPVRTGRLRRSGGSQTGNLFLSIFYDAYYARFVDLGTSRMVGRHYFFRILKGEENKVISAINKGVGSMIKSSLGKG